MSLYSARARHPRPAWWLRLASSSPYRPQYTIADRERARRSDLIAWLALGMFGVVLIVSPIAIDDTQALLVYLGFVLALVLIIALNRMGQITLAGGLLVSCVTGAVFAYMLSSPLGLTMGQLPNYDALAVGVVVAASVLPRASGFVVAAINSGLIVADYLLRPHNANITADAALYSSVVQQTVSLLVRPIALQFIFAVIAYLWVRGTDRAIRRADRAEEIAALEAMELERTRILEEGVGYVRQTIARWVRGDLKARVPIMPVPALRNMCDDLNGFIIAFSYLSNADYHLRRLQGEVSALTVALRLWAPVACHSGHYRAALRWMMCSKFWRNCAVAPPLGRLLGRRHPRMRHSAVIQSSQNGFDHACLPAASITVSRAYEWRNWPSGNWTSVRCSPRSRATRYVAPVSITTLHGEQVMIASPFSMARSKISGPWLE